MEASFYVEVLLKNNIFQAAIFQFRFSSPGLLQYEGEVKEA